MGELEGEEPCGGGAESPHAQLAACADTSKVPGGSPKNSVGKSADGSSINSFRARWEIYFEVRERKNLEDTN